MKFRVLGIILGILLLGASLCFGHGDEEVSEDQVIEKQNGEYTGFPTHEFPFVSN